jgi:hypothetical protein
MGDPKDFHRVTSGISATSVFDMSGADATRRVDALQRVYAISPMAQRVALSQVFSIGTLNRGMSCEGGGVRFVMGAVRL